MKNNPKIKFFISIIFLVAFFVFLSLKASAAPLAGTNADLDQYAWFDGTTYTDLTIAANDATASDFTLGSDTTTGSPAAYFGMNNKFNQLKFNIGTLGAGGTVAWEYWNGSAWLPQTVTDNTNNFIASGTVDFVPSSDWGKKDILTKEVEFIAGGDLRSSIIRKSDGTVWSWGWGTQNSQLGNGINSNSLVPVQASNLAGITANTNSGEHSLALKSDGTVWAWGNNNYGQLGNGVIDPNYSGAPVQVSNLTNVTAIAEGMFHSLAVKSDGTVWTWGDGRYGQLGNGTNINSNVPVQVSGLTDAIAVAGSNGSSIALKSDGTVWAWGSGYLGVLGNGNSIDSNVPVQVSGLTGVTAIAGGLNQFIALKSDGTVWAWGYNNYGQLGNGTNTNSNVPVQVSNLSGITAISGGSGNYHFIALKSDGTVWAWGWNLYGQLGNGTNIDSNVPVEVSNLTGVTKIAGGIYHALALKSDGTVWAWGYC